MKKFYFIAAMAVASLTANAQEKLNLSTYNGTNIEKYDGKICNVTVNRFVFNGWNTIALPFSITEDELNEIFGSDCRLEKLIGVENNGNGIVLNFQDCKAKGLMANTPYILYYNGETANKKICKEAGISNDQPVLNYTTKYGETVTMAGVQTKIDGVGLYGVLARDNSEAKFVRVSEDINGFYATRCYIQLSTGNDTQLFTNHLGANEVTSISAVAKDNDIVDVYTIQGVKVASRIPASQVNGLTPNVYVVKGQKVVVK
jgi:hypothetical protein